ncbi:MAG: hypothetical protein NVSMB3_02180 [Acidobacteriaceae bacterium]
MQRRNFVKAVVSAVAAPQLLLGQSPNPTPPLPAPVPWTEGLNPGMPIPKVEVTETFAQTETGFFTPSQMATLRKLSDVLVPSLGEKPGALAAETPAFLDFLIGSSPAERRQMYQGGLDWLDAESKKQFSKPFADLETAQADRILKPWMRTWMSDHPPTETHADFVNIAHSDIRTATVNSKAWSDAPASPAQGSPQIGLYWYPIEPDLYAAGPARMRTPAAAIRPSR